MPTKSLICSFLALSSIVLTSAPNLVSANVTQGGPPILCKPTLLPLPGSPAETQITRLTILLDHEKTSMGEPIAQVTIELKNRTFESFQATQAVTGSWYDPTDYRRVHRIELNEVRNSEDPWQITFDTKDRLTGTAYLQPKSVPANMTVLNCGSGS